MNPIGTDYCLPLHTQRKIVEVILLNFRSNLGHKDKLEAIKVIKSF